MPTLHGTWREEERERAKQRYERNVRFWYLGAAWRSLQIAVRSVALLLFGAAGLIFLVSTDRKWLLFLPIIGALELIDAIISYTNMRARKRIRAQVPADIRSSQEIYTQPP
jgi:hypothetical protein